MRHSPKEEMNLQPALCIDLHQGQVKQIGGGSLHDQGSQIMFLQNDSSPGTSKSVAGANRKRGADILPAASLRPVA